MTDRVDTDDPLTGTLSIGTSERTIQVLVSKRGDRRGLQEILGDRYDVVTDTSLQSAECYLFDSRSLHQYADELSRHKAERHPEFCPVIVMEQPGSSMPEKFADPDADGLPLVDDVIDAPIDLPVLHRRLRNLLIRRDQSLALTRKYEEMETWFKGLFDAIPDPAFVLSTDGRVHEANDAFCAFADRERREYLDVKLEEVPVYRPVYERIEAHLEEAHRDETHIENETIEFDSNDERMEYGILSSQLTEVQGKQYLIGILSDVTELQKKTFRLEKLASVLNHDLRNPAQVAEMRLGGLKNDHPESRDEIEACQRAITRINELTEKLVTIARTGQGMEVDDVMLASCAREAWSHVETVDAELILEDVDGVSVTADEDLLLELFENLYRNSMEHGGESVSVTVGKTEDRFYIEDDGPGIPPEERDDVLRLGYSNNPQGNGLGLGIVEEIVEEHGWNVTITGGREDGARIDVHCNCIDRFEQH
jgi:PAS domain S-box-containing protein